MPATLTHVKQYGDCIGPLGFQMPSALAKAIERILKTQPADAKSAFRAEVNGESVEGYCRSFKSIQPIETNAGERSETSLVTTASLDRDFEVLDPKGAEWNQFKKNPVVTFAHDYRSLPVGRAAWVKRQSDKDPNKDGWLAKTVYASKPDGWSGDWTPDAIWHLIQSGFLGGKSIGFIPTRYREIEEADIKKRPELAAATWVIEKYVVIEYAVAPVQSNPDALVAEIGKMKTKGLVLTDDIMDACGIVIPLVGEPPGSGRGVGGDDDDFGVLPAGVKLAGIETVDDWRRGQKAERQAARRAARRAALRKAVSDFDPRAAAGEALVKMRGGV